MTNGSPGRNRNRAFRIGDDEFESETSFTRSENRAGSSDPLGHLLTSDINEHSPLVLENIREENEDSIVSIPSSPSTPNNEDRLPSSLDVFMVNSYDGSWKPSARFGRFEWDVEGFDNHLGTPHVSCMGMATYLALQQILAKTVIQRHVIFEGVEALMHYLETTVTDTDFPELGVSIKDVISNRIKALKNSEEKENKALNKKHSTSTQSLNSEHISHNPTARIPRNLISEPNNLASLDEMHDKKLTPSKSGLRWGASFVKPPPQIFTDPHYDNTSEHSVLISGSVPEASVCRLVAIRFDEAAELQEFLPGGEKKTRTIYFLIGPILPDHSYLDLARAFGTIVSNPVSNSVFDHLRSAELIAQAVDRFLEETVVIAPGKIVSKNYINADYVRRKVNMNCEKHEKERANSLSVVQHPLPQPKMNASRVHPSDVDVEKGAASSKEVVIDGYRPFFGGAKQDVVRRFRHFKSDFTDGYKKSQFPVVAYMFCVTVVPTLTFAAILDVGTEGKLSVKSCLVSQVFSGILWSFLSCQPLLIMSPTGPFLVFEKALFRLAISWGYDFLELRLYTGIWLFLITILGAALNWARYIRYVTVYTEDIFCALISLIFFSGVWEFLSRQYELNPIVDLSYYVTKASNCTGSSNNCDLSSPNTFLIQAVLLVLSISVFHYFRQIGISKFLGRTGRNLCNNFGGIFAVGIVSLVYFFLFRNVDVSMVRISEPDAAIFQSPISGFVIPSQPPTLKLLALSFAAACLLYVLIFVETEIPEQMALRPKRKLKKGGGLHWDPMVVGLCTVFSSFTGLPWMCPAAVQSLAHIDAVTVYEKTAQGDPKKIKRVKEQRLSGLITYIMLFVVASFGHYVPIPSAAIFGVFCYLGIRNLEGNQMVERMIMPFLLRKNRGAHKYLEMAPFFVICLYTFFQFGFVIFMYSIKTHDIFGLAFPLILVLIAWLNRVGLPFVFDDKLLEALESEEEDEKDDDEETAQNFYENARIPV